MPPDGVHEQGLAEGRAPAGPALQVDRRRHVDEGERHELGEAARSRAGGRGCARRWRAQTRGLLDGAEHDGDVRAQPDARGPCGGPRATASVLILSGQRTAAHLVVEDLGGGAGQGLEAGLLAARVRYVGQGPSERRAPSVTSSAVKAWMWMRRRAGAHRPRARRGSSRRRSWGGCRPGGRPRWPPAPRPRATRSVISSSVEQVGVAAQVERERALGEGAEPALEGADVGVVDVAVDDEGDVVADDVRRSCVGHLGHGAGPRAPGREEGDDLVLADLLARASPRPAPRRPHRAAVRARCADGAPAVASRRPPEHHASSRARPFGVGASSTGEAERRVEPALGVERRTPGRR